MGGLSGMRSAALPLREERRFRPLTKLFREVWRARRSSKVNSYRPAFPGRLIFAEDAGRALRSFRSPPSGRFGPFGPKCPQGTHFPPVPGGRGVCAPGRKHFLSIWRKRPAQPDFFDKLNAGPKGPAFLLRRHGVSRSFPARCTGRGQSPADRRQPRLPAFPHQDHRMGKLHPNGDRAPKTEPGRRAGAARPRQ